MRGGENSISYMNVGFSTQRERLGKYNPLRPRINLATHDNLQGIGHGLMSSGSN